MPDRPATKRRVVPVVMALLLVALSGCGLLVPEPTPPTEELWLQAENHRAEPVTVEVFTGEGDFGVEALSFDVGVNEVVSDQLARVQPSWVILVDGAAVYRSSDAPEGETARRILLLDVRDAVTVDDSFWVMCQNQPDSPACERPTDPR